MSVACRHAMLITGRHIGGPLGETPHPTIPQVGAIGSGTSNINAIVDIVRSDLVGVLSSIKGENATGGVSNKIVQMNMSGNMHQHILKTHREAYLP
jgi:hypothetical protein